MLLMMTQMFIIITYQLLQKKANKYIFTIQEDIKIEDMD